jgi:hypothetical protein
VEEESMTVFSPTSMFRVWENYTSHLLIERLAAKAEKQY